jgi:23S rRNA (cytidine2498-2'-O)-methyltransferase
MTRKSSRGGRRDQRSSATPERGRSHGPPKRGPKERARSHATQDNRQSQGAPERRRSHGASERGGSLGRPARGSQAPWRERGGAARPAPPDLPRIDPRQLAEALGERPAPLRVGEWLWTCREGAERDLVEELLVAAGGPLKPRRLAAALVASAAPPALREGRLDVTFARQGFKVRHIAQADGAEELAAALWPALERQLTELGADTPIALHAFVPDSTHGNERSDLAQAVRQALLDQHAVPLLDDALLRRQGGPIVHLCLFDARTVALGCMPSDQALSLWPGGRARMRLAGSFPSRAARKLAEAFAWLNMAPSGGELCVDLGAAPGGWSWLLLEKKARVIAVDPARMAADLAKNTRLKHIQGSAFDYAPEQPVDWLFCDMAWRPLEVAQMLGRWARQRHTRLLVANFKLPMKRKVEMVERLRGVLAEQGFTGIRTRQLYHDREEITLTAYVR